MRTHGDDGCSNAASPNDVGLTAMGLGCARGEWDDFEWFVLDAQDSDAEQVWVDDAATRVLLCDLDNLRAGPRTLAARMRVAVDLARQADVVAFAGQADTVGRCTGLLEEFAGQVMTVGAGRDAADYALLDVADRVRSHGMECVVMSNDGIFARLALRGPLTVVSPRPSAASTRLVAASRVILDVRDLDRADVVAAVA